MPPETPLLQRLQQGSSRPPGVSGTCMIARICPWALVQETALLGSMLCAIRERFLDAYWAAPEPVTLHSQLPIMPWIVEVTP